LDPQNLPGHTLSVASVDQQVASVDQQVASVDQQVASVDQQAASVDQQVASVVQQVASVDQQVASVDQQVASVVLELQFLHLCFLKLPVYLQPLFLFHHNSQQRLWRFRQACQPFCQKNLRLDQLA
jgi:hypothetical protein